MKKCSDLEHLLPLYAEGALSEEEKRTVEKHLADCAPCRREFAYLSKAGELVKELPQVEEPPWFQQQIMAGVRKEADRKSSVRKWFYPLRFKIPVQIMATIVIAVLAVYIYRSGDERLKSVLLGAPKPSVEVLQEQPSAPLPEKAEPVRQSPLPENKPVAREEIKKDRVPKEPAVVTGGAPKTEALPGPADAVSEAQIPAAKGKMTPDKDKANGAFQTVQNEAAADREQMIRQEDKARDQAVSLAARKKESYKMAAPAAPQAMGAASEAPSPAVKSAVVMAEARVFMQADDPAAAAAEAEKILVRQNAKRVSRQPMEAKVIVRAEVPVGNWKEILAKLKAIGPLEEKVSPADPSGVIRVAIEISGR